MENKIQIKEYFKISNIMSVYMYLCELNVIKHCSYMSDSTFVFIKNMAYIIVRRYQWDINISKMEYFFN